MSTEDPPINPPDLPPKPPEYDHSPSTRAILVAWLGTYADLIGRAKKTKASYMFLHAPIEHIQGVSPPQKQSTGNDSHGAGEYEIDSHTLDWVTRRYQAVRRALDADLEKEDTLALNEHWAFNIIKNGLEKGLERDLSAEAIVMRYNDLRESAREHGVAEMFSGIAQPLTDPGFVDRFHYDSAVVGLKNEVLALLPSSGSTKQRILLGMTVTYTKKIEPSGQTGPLSGTGRVAAFLLPTRAGDIIPDQVIQLEVHTEEGAVPTLLSPDEVSVG